MQEEAIEDKDPFAATMGQETDADKLIEPMNIFGGADVEPLNDEGWSADYKTAKDKAKNIYPHDLNVDKSGAHNKATDLKMMEFGQKMDKISKEGFDDTVTFMNNTRLQPKYDTDEKKMLL